MNLSQFQSWFEGFTENMSGPPNNKQWARIQERVAEITPEPMPAPVFIDRYIRPYPRYWGPTWTATNSAEMQKIVSTADENTAFFNAGKIEARQVVGAS